MSFEPIMMLPLQQQLAFTSLQDIICFIVSFQRAAQGIYYAFVQAKELRSQGKKYNYTFCYMNQCKVYTACQIIELEADTLCTSLNDLLGDSNSLDGVIRVFFKLRLQFTSLYAAYINALDAKNNQAYTFFYTFTNPFFAQENAGNLALIDGVWKMNRDCIIRTFQCCQLPSPVQCPTLTLSANRGTLPPFSIGTPYTQTFTVNGGTAPYTWSGINLPPDLTLTNQSTNTIDLSGSINGIGVFNYTINVSDSYGCNTTFNATLNTCPSFSINISTSGTPQQGNVYSETYTVIGATQPLTWTISIAPPNLLLTYNPNSNQAILQGICGVQGTYNYTITLTDANGCNTSFPRQLIIIP